MTYTPATGFNGTDTFTYTVTDGSATDTATVTVAVANGTPAAADDEATTGRNRPVDIAVLANDTDPDGDTLTITDATTPADGTVAVNADGTITYTPATGFTGTDTFDYTITDGIATDTATVTVAVTNGTPAAVDDEATTGRNRPVDIAVLANDTDPDGDTLTITDVTTPTDGTVAVNGDGTITYTPATGFTGTDTFDYTITDGIATDTATVTVAVANGTPDAADDEPPPDATGRSTSVLANDTDPDGDTLTITDATTPAEGTVAVKDDGTITYTPATGFTGTDTFDYTVTDGIATDTATVTVAVANAAPTADDDTASTETNTPVLVDVLDGDTDPNGDALTPVIVDQPSHGAAQVNDDGTVTYTPADGFKGTDSFTYRASDGDLFSNRATVTIAVGNAAPTADDDTTSTETNTPVVVDVLDGDTDPNGDALTPVIANQPSHGAAQVNDDGTVTYTPADGFRGVDSFTYRASDGDLSSNPATVTIAVANAVPTADNDSALTDTNTPVVVDVLQNDSDPNDDTLTPVIATSRPTARPRSTTTAPSPTPPPTASGASTRSPTAPATAT